MFVARGFETLFEDSYSVESFDELSVVPRQGLGLFFEHPVHHKGNRIHSGRKYVLRTDVMYRPVVDDTDYLPEDYDEDWN